MAVLSADQCVEAQVRGERDNPQDRGEPVTLRPPLSLHRKDSRTVAARASPKTAASTRLPMSSPMIVTPMCCPFRNWYASTAPMTPRISGMRMLDLTGRGITCR